MCHKNAPVLHPFELFKCIRLDNHQQGVKVNHIATTPGDHSGKAWPDLTFEF